MYKIDLTHCFLAYRLYSKDSLYEDTVSINMSNILSPKYVLFNLLKNTYSY